MCGQCIYRVVGTHASASLSVYRPKYMLVRVKRKEIPLVSPADGVPKKSLVTALRWFDQPWPIIYAVRRHSSSAIAFTLVPSLSPPVSFWERQLQQSNHSVAEVDRYSLWRSLRHLTQPVWLRVRRERKRKLYIVTIRNRITQAYTGNIYIYIGNRPMAAQR